MNTVTAPSLIGAGAPPSAASAPQTLLDLMYDGFYALFMLKNGNGPQDDGEFARKMSAFLDDFGRGAKKQNASPDDVDNAKYAFCAAVDEIILRSSFSIRDAWERRVAGLRGNHVDPDSLDERARAMLNLADPADIVVQYAAKDKLF